MCFLFSIFVPDGSEKNKNIPRGGKQGKIMTGRTLVMMNVPCPLQALGHSAATYARRVVRVKRTTFIFFDQLAFFFK